MIKTQQNDLKTLTKIKMKAETIKIKSNSKYSPKTIKVPQ